MNKYTHIVQLILEMLPITNLIYGGKDITRKSLVFSKTSKNKENLFENYEFCATIVTLTFLNFFLIS